MDFKTYINNLSEKLNAPLPGHMAWQKMAPVHRQRAEFSKAPIPAGVLLALYPHKNDVILTLTKRPEYNGHHSGQVSFPGGKMEKTDESITETALRETHEEIGIEQSLIHVLGALSELLIPVSNFKVTPVVGWLNQQPTITPNPYEVEKVIKIPLSRLLDKDIVKYKQGVLNNTPVEIPYYDIEKYEVWGATAMILSEFIEINRSILAPSIR